MRDTSLSWQKKLAQGFSCAADLLNYLELPTSFGSSVAEKQFSTRVPLSFAKRMQKRNPKDPLLLQVLATEAELNDDYEFDPLQERQSNLLKGMIHKYSGRVLITLTGICAVNCRFCFRRHFPYQENNPGRPGLNLICDYISKDKSITEVILSGGDPLLASDQMLSELIQLLEAIPHVHTLRFHTRVPIVFPERINQEFIATLSTTKLQKVVVVHSNHPQELNDDSVSDALKKLRDLGCYLLNQSVLLSGINDDALILAELSQSLFRYGVIPYYLHILDKVKGAAHFDLPFTKAQAIYQQLQKLLPGYLVPRLVREEAGKLSKTILI
jgi:EF-P beta-lysylation protein EpmB